uniref:Uncharacterized protein n=1 Tax=Anguilla anguilla TaxID=7936 RepID=A0A0E9QHX5_ANGAN
METGLRTPLIHGPSVRRHSYDYAPSLRCKSSLKMTLLGI